MIGIGFQVYGDRVLAQRFVAANSGVQRGVNQATRASSLRLLELVQQFASGRPGPEVQTGQYRSSWSVTFTGAGGVLSGDVGTDAPQAARLEFGFHGVDSIGRRYNQPPFPHMIPASNIVDDEYELAILAMLEKVI